MAINGKDLQTELLPLVVGVNTSEASFRTGIEDIAIQVDATIGALSSVLDIAGTFTASGNIIEVTGTGAGGGGGGGSFNGGGGDGGDAAFMDGAIIAVTAGDTYTVVAGTGGNGGAGFAGLVASDGNAGSATTIISPNSVTLVSLGGGGAGNGGNNSGAGNGGAQGTISGNSTGSDKTQSDGTSTGLLKSTTPGVGLRGNGGASQGQQSGNTGAGGSIYIIF